MSQQLCAAPKVFQDLRAILVVDALVSISRTMPDPSESGGGQVLFRMGEWTGYHNTGCDQGVKFFYNIGPPFFSNHRADNSWKRVLEVKKKKKISLFEWGVYSNKIGNKKDD